jgi:hypothetical protein
MSALSGTVEAIDRLRLYFAPAPTRQGILARRALGEPAADDEVLSRRLVEKMLAEIRGDGSIPGGAVATVWRAHELLDLGATVDQPGLARLTSWTLALQGKPGTFSQGCTPARHSYHSCEHFLSGFFSPAPPEQRLAPFMLPDGKVFRAEPAARFAFSCLALRAALRADLQGREAIEQHVRSLIRLEEQWRDWSGYFAPDVIVAGIQALSFVPPAHRGVLPRFGAILVSHQAEDGTWPGADLFHTLGALVALGTAEARGALKRAVPALLARQRIDGSFGSTAPQERALIALRALIWADQEG